MIAGVLINFLAPVSTADQGTVVVPQALALDGKVHLLFVCVEFLLTPSWSLWWKKKKSENPVPVLPGSASMFSTFKGHTQHWGGL